MPLDVPSQIRKSTGPIAQAVSLGLTEGNRLAILAVALEEC